jgi:hypothetical protein
MPRAARSGSAATGKWEWRVFWPRKRAPRSLPGTSAAVGALRRAEMREDVYWHLGAELAPWAGLKQRSNRL